MKNYHVQITCTRSFEIEAKDAEDAERLAYDLFDRAPDGNYQTDFVTDLGGDDAS